MTLEELDGRYGHDWHIVPLRYGAAAWRRRPPGQEQFRQGRLYSLVGLDVDHLNDQLARQAALHERHAQPSRSTGSPARTATPAADHGVPALNRTGPAASPVSSD